MAKKLRLHRAHFYKYFLIFSFSIKTKDIIMKVYIIWKYNLWSISEIFFRVENALKLWIRWWMCGVSASVVVVGDGSVIKFSGWLRSVGNSIFYTLILYHANCVFFMQNECKFGRICFFRHRTYLWILMRGFMNAKSTISRCVSQKLQPYLVRNRHENLQ